MVYEHSMPQQAVLRNLCGRVIHGRYACRGGEQGNRLCFVILVAVSFMIIMLAGEESKVILVSLVRSNDQGKAGFLNTTNRVNVLLSRAMHGMVLVGNADTFCSTRTTPMWRDVIGQLKKAGKFGDKLPLQCRNHPDDIMLITEPEEFDRLAGDGGCARQCSFRRHCGHACERR